MQCIASEPNSSICNLKASGQQFLLLKQNTALLSSIIDAVFFGPQESCLVTIATETGESFSFVIGHSFKIIHAIFPICFNMHQIEIRIMKANRVHKST